MESRPTRRRRIRRSPPPLPRDDDDRISALGDDTLVEILARLRCTRAAARTSLLSRRWRNLWTRLPDLTFRGLALVPRPAAVSLLDIRLEAPSPLKLGSDKVHAARARSVLRAAARLSPQELVFVAFPWRHRHEIRGAQFVLPASLRRATSIELDTLLLRVKPPPGDLPALERLSLAVKIVGIGDFLDRCPRLRELRVTFRAVSLAAAEAELATIQARRDGLALSLLGIEHITVAAKRRLQDDSRLPHLLHAAARLSPQELVVRHGSCASLYLPCFPEATSIELSLYGAYLEEAPDGEFSALETLTLSYSSFVSLETLVSRCPRLRVLRVINSGTDMSISSASLQELVFIDRDDGTYGRECHYIDIETPVLKQLKLKFQANKDYLSVYISAPMLEKVSWCQSYTDRALVFGSCNWSWRLGQTNLETVESSSGQDNNKECSLLHVLRLDMSAEQCHPGEELNFAKEMEKLPFTDFSALELHLTTRGHVFREFVLRLLEMHHFKATTRLKVVLVATSLQVRRACPENCFHSDESKNLGSQRILLTHLEEVEIDGFQGGDRELDFLTHVLGCTPMLKRMTVKLSPEHQIYHGSKISHGCCTTKIYSILLAYPSVSCYVYRSSGELVPHTCIQSA